ncbi:hypothetical protein ACFWVM_34060 [Nocardia fluminea]|uniref:hypothetical protein n=1 Tax=Nocardia fluminea TaxID=134984 RepID=UPI00364B2167
MGRRKSADELAGELAGIGEQIQRRTAEETRQGLAREIEEQFIGGANGRSAFAGQSPTECIVSALEDMRAEGKAPPELEAIAEEIERDGVPEAFTAGILFAARCMDDLSFEF